MSCIGSDNPFIHLMVPLVMTCIGCCCLGVGVGQEGEMKSRASCLVKHPSMCPSLSSHQKHTAPALRQGAGSARA